MIFSRPVVVRSTGERADVLRRHAFGADLVPGLSVVDLGVMYVFSKGLARPR